LSIISVDIGPIHLLSRDLALQFCQLDLVLFDFLEMRLEVGQFLLLLIDLVLPGLQLPPAAAQLVRLNLKLLCRLSLPLSLAGSPLLHLPLPVLL